MKPAFEKINDIRLESLIYEGPNTLVYCGFSRQAGKTALIKLLKPQQTGQADRVKRFQREAQAYRALQHPNIVQLYDSGVCETWRYLILEYMAGGSLKALLAESGVLPLDVALPVARQILQALQAAHQQQIVHRDIKPGNILLDWKGLVKVADFGLARPEAVTDITQAGTIMGTIGYMAPEQITGGEIDGRADIFAFGCVCYEMLSGKKAFEGKNISATLHHLLNETPPPLQNVEPQISGFIMRCLAKDPDDRWPDVQTAEAALADLSQIVDISPTAYAEFFGGIFGNKAEKNEGMLHSIKERKVFEEPARFAKFNAKIFLPLALLSLILLIIFSIPESNTPPLAINSDLPISSMPIQSPDSALSENLPKIIPAPEEEKMIHSDTLIQSSEKFIDSTSSKLFTDAAMKEGGEILEDSVIQEAIAMPAPVLNVYRDSWAAVYLNDTRLTDAVEKHHLTIQPGKHELRFIHANFPPHIEQFTISSGDTHRVEWHFADRLSYLWLEVHPWANVYINGDYVDATPLSRPLPLKSGTHVLELRHPQMQPFRENIKIVPGDTLQKKVVLK